MGACASVELRGSRPAARVEPPARSRQVFEGIIRNIPQALRKFRRCDGARIRFGDIELGPDLLNEILTHVPDVELIKTCRLVCKYWKRLVDDDQTWINRALIRGHLIPEALTNGSRKTLPQHTFMNIAMRDPFGRNLIRNPCGEDQLKGWKNAVFGVMGDFSSTNSYGWSVEDPPQGASSLDLVPELREAGYTSCFATSHFRCAKDQRIDLYKEGITKEMMYDLQPDIHVGEWHSASLEYGTTYWLLIEILDYENNVVEQFRYVYKKSAGVPLPWTKVIYVFPRHQRIRYIRFYHESVVTEYLQNNDFPDEYFVGQRGNKMTGATVKLRQPCESPVETKKRNSKDINLYSLLMGPKKADSEGNIPVTFQEDIFTAKPDEEGYSSLSNSYEWSLINEEPEDSKKRPEVRYVSLINASGTVTNWVMKEHYDVEQEENVLYQ